MTYNYREQRSNVFTEEGSSMLLRIRDQTKALLSQAGVARCDKMISKCSGDTWDMLACVDRLVEIGELYEIPNTISSAGQHRIFMSKTED